MALRVYGVVAHNGHTPPNLPMGAQLLPLRDLAVVTEEAEYSTREAAKDDVDRHIEIVDAVFKHDAIVPAPVGTVFKSEEVLQRWIELHYVALSDALAWFEDRVAARVHVDRADLRGAGRPSQADAPAIAMELVKDLRRNAVASFPLRNEGAASSMLSAAFLVERALWQEFKDAVQAEAARHPILKLEVTGPWPPYDFVRMQFGA